MAVTPNSIKNRFDNLELDANWSFEKEKSVNKWTHGYHRYPAKFLPNLVSKLIDNYTNPQDTIADLFAGCGTTLVEAKVHGRKSIGVDINPVAELITKAKIHPVSPEILNANYDSIIAKIDNYVDGLAFTSKVHERIDYWFTEDEKNKIAFLINIIDQLSCEQHIKDFFYCCLSNILKNSSRWLQSSTKPQIDPDKDGKDSFSEFKRHYRVMEKKNREFFKVLEENGFFTTQCEIKLEDARKTTIESKSIDAIITSPPYVTSYEYADIHQLTGFWFGYIDDLPKFRKNFIGTFYSNNTGIEVPSKIANEIIDAVNERHKKSAREVANYFNDMYYVCLEMNRIIKDNGTICLVVGNTELRNIKIKTAEFFVEVLTNLGFKPEDLIKRAIPHKLIPTIRDKTTGKFSKVDSVNSRMVYPEEYILIFKK
ncbi:DNA methyltransferase [Emticicia agri]|uniref:Methyltransferase n=1 Tax=Emticicia agri TaxID=2492393 RepID=A0A4Q5LX62_9BACT|nr:DNA methyltransferase [Emticicia agri]RYU94189.1 hypothetical protein EWM59_17970 [Emticicia agri]